MNLNRIAYKPVGLALGMVAGAIAGMAFDRIWRLLPGTGDDPPQAIDKDRNVAEILVAAALQGAVFAVVRAAVDRGGAHVVRRITGHWPD